MNILYDYATYIIQVINNHNYSSSTEE